MSRLYYEPAFRQTRGAPMAMGAGPEVEPPPGGVGEFARKVSQLVPIEVIAAFMAILGVGRAGSPAGDTVVRVGFALCLIVTPLYLLRMSANDPPGAPKVVHLALSTLAFAVWGYAIGGVDLAGKWYEPTVAGALPIFYMLVAGLVPLKK